jgi:hypothetical protein
VKSLLVNQSRHGFGAVIVDREVNSESEVQVYLEDFGPYPGRVAWVRPLSEDPGVLLIGVELVEDV